MSKKRTNKEIEANWENKWKEILERPDGSINIDQLKLELMDFEDLIDRHISLVHKVTKGRMSYATYDVDAILEVITELVAEEVEETQKDDKEDGHCSFCERDFE